MLQEATVVADHFSFLAEIGERMRGARLNVTAEQRHVVTDVLPGLQELFATLVSASPCERAVKDRRIEEWNPLSQRILLPDERPVTASNFETEFALAAMYSQTLIEWAHEAIHVLALEPWFTGQRRIDSEECFVTWYAAGEALAFWYADIVVTRAIRRTVPGAELVFTRTSVSNTGFHPEQAFEQLGLTRDDDILPVYVAGFLNEPSELVTSRHPLCSVYGRRLRDFYRESSVTLKSLYSILKEVDVFGSFQHRFCRSGDLPSILPPEQIREAAALSLPSYAVALGQRLLPGISGTTATSLGRVAARRHIQTRAYHAWLLHWALSNGWVSADGAFESRTVVAHVGVYLNMLEAALDGLAIGGTPEAAFVSIAAADHVYEGEIRTPLVRATAHVRYRYWIFPYSKETGGLIGYWDGRTAYSPDEADAAARKVFARCRWEPDLIELLADFLVLKRRGRESEARRVFNAFLRHPAALPEWAILLGDINPAQNRFREPLFEFH